MSNQPSPEAAAAAASEREHPDFSDARRGSDPSDDPINATYPGNDLLHPPRVRPEEDPEPTDDDDAGLRTDTAEWLENQTPERGRPEQVEERRHGSAEPSSDSR